MTREQWRGLHDSLLEFGGLTRPTEPEAAFAPELIEQIYDRGRLLWP
jgi:hypothetical protein